MEKFKLKKKGLYHDLITQFCSNECSWNEKDTENRLEVAIQHKKLSQIFIRDKISYRVLYEASTDDVSIRDCVENASSQTEHENYCKFNDMFDAKIDALHDDFVSFKKFMFSEIATTKAMILTPSENVVTDKSQKTDMDIVECLKDRIKSLEKQLDNKQVIIESLLTTLQTSNNKVETLSVKPVNPKGVSQVTLTNNKKSDNANVTEVINKKSVIIIGDSMLNGINERGISKDDIIKIKAHSGSSSEDLIDYIKPDIKKKPDIIILHIGTNDISKNKTDTIENLEKIRKHALKTSPKTKFVISSITTRKDKPEYDLKIAELNKRLKKYCEENLFDFINNDNVDVSCLGTRKLHLNAKGKSYIANNFISYLDKFKPPDYN